MMPPVSKVGICGIEKPLPPSPGIQLGTLKLSDPTVLFQMLAMPLKASLKGLEMVEASPPNQLAMSVGRLVKNVTTEPQALVTAVTAPVKGPESVVARLENQEPTFPGRPVKKLTTAFQAVVMAVTASVKGF